MGFVVGFALCPESIFPGSQRLTGGVQVTMEANPHRPSSFVGLDNICLALLYLQKQLRPRLEYVSEGMG